MFVLLHGLLLRVCLVCIELNKQVGVEARIEPTVSYLKLLHQSMGET